MTTRLEREVEISSNPTCTPADWETITRGIDFPENLKGKFVLDIGSGASEAVIRLRRSGVIAIGIDSMYTSLKELKKRVDGGLNKFVQDQKQITSEFSEVDVNIVDANFRQLVNRLRRSRDNFFDSLADPSVPYIAAIGGNLPFRDNTFDFCYSHEGLTGILIHDGKVFINGVFEAIRVLKPDSELQMVTWKSPSWTQQMSENAEALLIVLNVEQIPFKEDYTASGKRKRLRIMKSSAYKHTVNLIEILDKIVSGNHQEAIS